MSQIIVVVDSTVIQKVKDKRQETKRMTASGVVAWALDKVLKDKEGDRSA